MPAVPEPRLEVQGAELGSESLRNAFADPLRGSVPARICDEDVQCSHYIPRVTGRWSGRAGGLTDVRSHQATVRRLVAGCRRHGQADNGPNRSSSPGTVTGPAASTAL